MTQCCDRRRRLSSVPWLWVWCAGIVLLIQGTACHAFRVCGKDDCDGLDGRGGAGEATDGGAGGATDGRGGSGTANTGGDARMGDGAAAGVVSGGDAGLAGDPSNPCAAPRASCDDSVPNGCESDLSLDVRNCGRCGARCVGVCAAGACHAFEPLIDSIEVPDFGGIAVTSSQAYCLSTPIASDETELLSCSKDGVNVSTLVSGLTEVNRLLPGIDRLYLFSSDASTPLWSVPFAGGALHDEQLGAQAAALSGTWLYTLDANGKFERRNEIHRDVVEPLPLPAQVSPSAAMTLSATGAFVALVASDSATSRYSVFILDPAQPNLQWELVGSGLGSPGRIRLGQNAVYLALTIASGSGELREHRFDGSERTLSSAPELIDFAVYANEIVYVSWRDGDQRRLRVLSLADPQHGILDLQASDALRSLEIDGQYLYFGGALRRNVARLPLWIDAIH